MTNSIKNLIRSIGVGFTVILAHHYGGKILDYKEQEMATKLQNENDAKMEILIKNTDLILKNQDSENNQLAKLQECGTLMENSKNYYDSGDNINGKDQFDKAGQCIDSLIDFLTKSKNNFHIDLTPLYQYLDTLTLLEESALLHICFFSLILFTLINIISTLFANEIIQYFNLENKHPFLKKLLMLRSKFQRYYFILNFSLIFIIIIVALYLNIIILI